MNGDATGGGTGRPPPAARVRQRMRVLILGGWRPSDPVQTIPVSVRWHMENPPQDPDQDFSPDERALAGAAP